MAFRRALDRVGLASGLMGAALLHAQVPMGILLTEQSRTAFSAEGAGARAMGLGGAFIAVADDATAASFNPAGLAQLLKPELSLVGRALRREVGFEDVTASARNGARTLALSDSLSASQRFDPLFASATMPLRLHGRTLALQLSVHRAFPLNESTSRHIHALPDEATGVPDQRLHQEGHQSGHIDTYTFSVAYELSQRILAGCSLSHWRGAWDLRFRSDYADPEDRSRFDYAQTNGFEGHNLTLGLIWRWPTWSLGLVRHTPFQARYTYESHLATDADLGGYTGDPKAGYGLAWPGSTGIGAAYRPTDRWLLVADLRHTPWSRARFNQPDSELHGLNFFDLSAPTEVPDVTSVHLGAEYLVLLAKGTVLPLRMGFQREPQPLRDPETGAIRVLQGVSLGTGFKRGRYTVDLAYRYGWARRRASKALESSLWLEGGTVPMGTERIRSHRLDLSFIVQFERRPLQRLLRHLFVGD